MLKQKGLLIDVVKCQACGACYDACKEQNKLAKTNDDPFKDRLSAETYTTLEQYKVKDKSGNELEVTSRKLCMHCVDPTCVSVCPVGALKKTELGPVVYDPSICLGCRYCMQACPHQIPRYEWTSSAPRVRKCVMCAERVKEGKPTACSEACPADATVFGDRDELIKIAEQRIKDEPDAYYPHIYGLKEAGGTNVLVLSPVPFDQLGYAGKLPEHALPKLTQSALDKIPAVVGVGGVFLSGMYWLTKRKNQIAKEEKNNN